MELYKLGKIISIGKTYIVLENNFSGYIIYVAKTCDWEKEKNTFKKVYLYKHHNEYVESLYGFKTFNERVLFEDLLSVNGIGPKTALNILKEGENIVVSWIASGDVNSLSKIPHMGIKSANQIIFELKGKYEKFDYVNQNKKLNSNEIKNTLKVLGFNPKQIEYAIKNLNESESIDEMIESSIKLISNAKFAT